MAEEDKVREWEKDDKEESAKSPEGGKAKSEESHGSTKKKTGWHKYIWYIVGGGIGLVGVAYYFLTSKGSSGSSGTSSQTATTIPVSGGGIAGGSYPSANNGSNSSSGTGMTGGQFGGYGSSILNDLQAQKKHVGSLESQLSALKNQYNNQSGFSSKQQGAINYLSYQIAQLHNQISSAKKTTASGTQPVTSGSKNYIVQSGNTLSGIAQSHGMSLAEIEKLNSGISNPNLIRPGQNIKL